MLINKNMSFRWYPASPIGKDEQRAEVEKYEGGIS
jgi:hypothetical protein